MKTQIDPKIKEVSNQIAAQIAKEMNSLVRSAITRHLGTEEWKEDDVVPYLRVQTDEQLNTLLYKGEPILVYTDTMPTSEPSTGKMS